MTGDFFFWCLEGLWATMLNSRKLGKYSIWPLLIVEYYIVCMPFLYIIKRWDFNWTNFNNVSSNEILAFCIAHHIIHIIRCFHSVCRPKIYKIKESRLQWIILLIFKLFCRYYLNLVSFDIWDFSVRLITHPKLPLIVVYLPFIEGKHFKVLIT